MGVGAAKAGTALRLYAETAGAFGAAGSIQTGFSIANSSSASVVVMLELTDLNGSPTGLFGTVTIPANGKLATFLSEIPEFAALRQRSGFQGILRITSPSPISMVGLRARYNERNDYLSTTTPPVNEVDAAPSGPLYFAHVNDGRGYTTQFVLLRGQAGQTPSTGTIQVFSKSGGVLDLILK